MKGLLILCFVALFFGLNCLEGFKLFDLGVCVEGDQKSCACGGDSIGFQVCTADSKYGHCQGCDSKPECLYNSDCDEGFACNSGACVEIIGCEQSSDCEAEYGLPALPEDACCGCFATCEQGECAIICVDAECCKTGNCDDVCQAVEPDCRDDSDCEDGFACSAGECVSQLICQEDADCEGILDLSPVPEDSCMECTAKCEQGECVGRCVDILCEEGYICSAGQCLPDSTCQQNTDCEEGQICSSNQCVTIYCGGLGDNQCLEGYTCNTSDALTFPTAYGICIPDDICGGIAGLHCPEGYSCFMSEYYPDASGICIPSVICGTYLEIQCQEGFTCQIQDGYPDSPGICVEDITCNSSEDCQRGYICHEGKCSDGSDF